MSITFPPYLYLGDNQCGPVLTNEMSRKICKGDSGKNNVVRNKVKKSRLLVSSCLKYRCDIQSSGDIFCHHDEIKHEVISISIWYIALLVNNLMLSWISGFNLKQSIIFSKTSWTMVPGERIIWTDASQGKHTVSLGIWFWSRKPRLQMRGVQLQPKFNLPRYLEWEGHKNF